LEIRNSKPKTGFLQCPDAGKIFFCIIYKNIDNLCNISENISSRIPDPVWLFEIRGLLSG